MRGIKTERGSSAITAVFIANLFMLGVLSVLVFMNGNTQHSFNNAGRAIAEAPAGR